MEVLPRLLPWWDSSAAGHSQAPLVLQPSPAWPQHKKSCCIQALALQSRQGAYPTAQQGTEDTSSLVQCLAQQIQQSHLWAPEPHCKSKQSLIRVRPRTHHLTHIQLQLAGFSQTLHRESPSKVADIITLEQSWLQVSQLFPNITDIGGFTLLTVKPISLTPHGQIQETTIIFMVKGKRGNELLAPKSGHTIHEQTNHSPEHPQDSAAHLLCAKQSSYSNSHYSLETITKKLSPGCWPC